MALNRLVSAVVEVILPEAERKALRLSVGHADNDPSVIGDRVALERVLLNLMSNAVKFTPAGGSVSITVRSGGGRVRVQVADSGMVIPAEDRPRLFERFFRAQNAGEASIAGTGLRLHIARSLAEQHGGGLTLSSVEGEGSRARASSSTCRSLTPASPALPDLSINAGDGALRLEQEAA